MKKLLFLTLLLIPVLLWAQEKSPDVQMQELSRSLEKEFRSIRANAADKRALGRVYGNIGGLYLDIARLPSENIKESVLVPGDKKELLRRAVEYSEKSIDAAEEAGDGEQLRTAYQNKYAAQKMAGKVKDAMVTYSKLTSLKMGSKKMTEMELKRSEAEFKRKEDSMRRLQEQLEQRSDQRSKEQARILAQQQQQLEATNKNLTDAQKEKDNVSHQLQRTQSDLSLEKGYSEEKTKQLTQAEQEKALQAANIQLQENELQMKQNELLLKQNELKIKDQDIESRKKEKYVYIAGLIVLLGFSLLIYRSFNAQKKFNTALIVEKKRSEELLLNILPAEVAGELIEKGFADAKHFYDVTVLFTDFVNFTTVAETMTPQQLVSELHVCFKAFDVILGKYHIEKIKTVGDAYLAVSGLPVANPKHAEDIVSASIEIRDFMAQRQKELGKSTFGIRVGINSGNVVAGIVGVRKFSYDIWGDTVNIAARMEQNSENGKINISESTYQLVKEKYPCVYRGKIEAKNKGGIDMYYIA